MTSPEKEPKSSATMPPAYTPTGETIGKIFPQSVQASAGSSQPPSERTPLITQHAITVPDQSLPLVVLNPAPNRRCSIRSVCWNFARACGKILFPFLFFATFFLYLFWIALPWTGPFYLMRTPGDRQVIEVDTRYLKQAQFNIQQHTQVHVIADIPEETDHTVFKTTTDDFSWVYGSDKNILSTLKAHSDRMPSRSQDLKDMEDGLVFWQRHYGLHKGGKLSVDYVLPDEACRSNPDFSVHVAFINLDRFDLESFSVIVDLNENLGCKGNFEFEARTYGHHFLIFAALPPSKEFKVKASSLTATGGSITIRGSTPTFPLPTNSLTSCTSFNSTCDIRFKSLPIRSRYAKLLLIDTRPAVGSKAIDETFPYIAVGKVLIYGPLRVLALVLVLGLFVFSLTTCCCGFSPVDAVNKIRGRERERSRGGVIVSYQSVPSEP
ncbi:hypothetical protein BC829DRAFT_396718 [Chytridium lagenaria]|nr:hypothetical protein BC829DRAFT_396718 [Chytridium lagenaria]